MKTKLLFSFITIFIILIAVLHVQMDLLESMSIEESIEINASPEEVLDFLYNLEDNYVDWHPKDHVVFKWASGLPLELGSKFYAEEYAMGEIKRYSGSIIEVVQNRKIVFVGMLFVCGTRIMNLLGYSRPSGPHSRILRIESPRFATIIP
jgi:hypothetical protein